MSRTITSGELKTSHSHFRFAGKIVRYGMSLTIVAALLGAGHAGGGGGGGHAAAAPHASPAAHAPAGHPSAGQHHFNLPKNSHLHLPSHHNDRPGDWNHDRNHPQIHDGHDWDRFHHDHDWVREHKWNHGYDWGHRHWHDRWNYHAWYRDHRGLSTFSGLVCRTSGQPIAHTRVTLVGLNGGLAGGATRTDATGHFVMSGVIPGEYRVAVDGASTLVNIPSGVSESVIIRVGMRRQF